jgi:phenylalanyl-tRNA synthetase beta chain
MRTSLVPGMLEMLAWNLNRGTSDIRLFEIGHVFQVTGEKSDERRMLNVAATGNVQESGVHMPGRPYTFFDMKGDVAMLLQGFEIPHLHFDTQTSNYFHPGRSARAVADGATVVQFGQLHPNVAAARKLKQDIYIAELYLDRLFAFSLRTPRYEPLSKFPAVSRDFSFVFPESVTFAQIETAVRDLRVGELQNFQPAEIFRGGAVPPGKYSILLRAEFQSSERTLRDEEVGQWWGLIIQALEKIGGALRS